MTHKELDNLLRSVGFPTAYSHFEKTQSPPFITFVRTGSENIGADNEVWSKRNNYEIVLYTDKKDIEKEKLIEDLLDSAHMYYDIDEMYIESEKLYAVIYSIQI